MPIYEYQCAHCGAHFELIRKFSDPPLERCTKCDADGPEKLVSASAFHLKGSGWYATDYGTGGNDTSGSADNRNSSEEKDGSGESTPSTGGDSGDTKTKDSGPSKDSASGAGS